MKFDNLKKTTLSICLSMTMLLLLAGCSTNNTATPPASGRKIILKAATTTSKDYPFNVGLEAMAQALAQKTDGQVEMQIFGDGQLAATEREQIESIQTGTIDIAVTNITSMSTFTPRATIFCFPYLFRDMQHLYKACDGEVGRIIGQDMEKIGIKLLAYHVNPQRGIFSTKPIYCLEDFQGSKHRIIQSTIKSDTIAALRGIPTPMAYGEVNSALQQGVIDSSEDVPTGFITMKSYEVAKYYTMANTDSVACPVMMSMKKWNTLSPEIQAAILESAVIGADVCRKTFEERTIYDIQRMQALGVTYIELHDLDKWKAATEPVRQRYESVVGKDLVDMVESL